MNSLSKEARVRVMTAWHEGRLRAEPCFIPQNKSSDSDGHWHWLELLAQYFTHIIPMPLGPGPVDNATAAMRKQRHREVGSLA